MMIYKLLNYDLGLPAAFGGGIEGLRGAFLFSTVFLPHTHWSSVSCR